MTETTSLLTLSIAGLAGLAMIVAGGLAGWRGWLDLQRLYLGHDDRRVADVAPAGARIELADLRERIRKLEAIAAGIDL